MTIRVETIDVDPILMAILQMRKLRPGKKLGGFFKGKDRNRDRTSRTHQDL